MIKKISILSLFPESFSSYLNQSIIKNAINNKKIEIQIIDYRQFANNKHKKVDDTPFGGGPGMVIQLEPIVDCLNKIKTENSCVILTTPSGYLYNQSYAKKFSLDYEHLIIICGHYEGIDERIYNFIDIPLSIGDYVLTGGEIPALIILDSVTRLLDGVINKESLISESFETNLLDYPVYTKPRVYDSYEVPDVLLSGNHQKIKEFREKMQFEKTKKYRPDLLKDK
ncbi:MAG: tRNA (guanosine(37)-N1)-methyltransferase TrmD [Ureaplasma sp.]|nr:tRNA (guanosine(37)-N1)-methyltransferase TrmD [Ureaplasma sp.]